MVSPCFELFLQYFETVLAIIDMFVALTTWRPYKVSFPPLEALKIIKREVDDGKLDKDIFEKFAYSVIGMSSKKKSPN